MLGYRVPAPDEAMLISGGKARGGGSPFRVVTGHGSWVMPFFRKARFLSLALNEAEVSGHRAHGSGGDRVQGPQR